MNRKVIVFGASGNTGSKICEQLQASKIENVGFVREGSKAKVKSDDSNVFYGDVLNIEDIEKAFKTNEFTDVVIALGSKDLINSSVRSLGTKNIVTVLNKLSLKCKLHVISALGVGDSWKQLTWFWQLISKLLLGSTMKDHRLQEEIVTNSSQAFHIIRPTGLTDGIATGKILNKTEGFLPGNDISRADVAKYLVDSMIAGKNGFSCICRVV